MKKLVVKTTDRDEIDFINIKEEDIEVGEKFITIGKEALIKMDNFCMYYFYESKDE